MNDEIDKCSPYYPESEGYVVVTGLDDELPECRVTGYWTINGEKFNYGERVMVRTQYASFEGILVWVDTEDADNDNPFTVIQDLGIMNETVRVNKIRKLEQYRCIKKI